MRKRSLCLFTVVCLLLSMLPFPAVAADTDSLSGTCGESLSWELDLTTGVLTISGTGSIPASGPWAQYTSQITALVLGEGITGVDASAFEGYGTITSITLPDTLTILKSRAFYNTAITRITIPSSCATLEEASLCTASLNEIVFLGSTEVKNYAFINIYEYNDYYMGMASQYTVAHLASIAFLGGVPTLNSNSFLDCDAMIFYPKYISGWSSFNRNGSYGGTFTWIPLTSANCLYGRPTNSSSHYRSFAWTMDRDTGAVQLYGTGSITAYDLKPWLDYADEIRSATIHDGITSVHSVFRNCSNLESVFLPQSLTTLSESSFANCTALKSVQLSWVTTIDDSAFYNCTSLTSIHSAGNNASLDITHIGYRAFWNCYRLSSFPKLPSLTTVEGEAFAGAFDDSANVSFYISPTVSSIHICAFLDNNLSSFDVDSGSYSYTCDSQGVLFNYRMTRLVAAPGRISGSYTVPEGVTTIDHSAFSGCKELEEVIFTTPITNWGDGWTFNNCASLKSVIIPEGTTTLPDFGFAYCNALTELTLPSTITTVGASTFGGFYNLEDLTFLGSAPAFEANAFQDPGSLIAYYPGDDATWTEDVRQNYGGTSVTWVPWYAPSTAPSLNVAYPSLVFEDEVRMNVYFSASELEDVVELGLATFDSAAQEAALENALTVVPGYTFDEAKGYYQASTLGIAAKDLDKTLYFALYYRLKDGTVGFTKTYYYSPATYAENLLVDGDAETQALVVAMLNYGAAAQTYFGTEDELMNSELTQEQQALVELYRADMVDALVLADAAKAGSFAKTEGYGRCYPSISFEGAFAINYYLAAGAVPQGDVTFRYWSAGDYTAAEALTADNATGTGVMTLGENGEYSASVTGIAAKDLDKTIYICITYTDGTEEYCSGVIAYSIGAYCVSQVSRDTDAADVAAATAVYGYYAKSLFA